RAACAAPKCARVRLPTPPRRRVCRDRLPCRRSRPRAPGNALRRASNDLMRCPIAELRAFVYADRVSAPMYEQEAWLLLVLHLQIEGLLDLFHHLVASGFRGRRRPLQDVA